MFNLIDRPLTGKELRAEFIAVMGEEWVLEQEKKDGKRIDEWEHLPKEPPKDENL